MSEATEFRSDIRGWLAENSPKSVRGPGETAGGGTKQVIRNPDVRLWLDRCVEKGYTAPTWPREYGGAGMDRAQALIFNEEMRAIGARRPLAGMGLSMIGPTLLELGTDEQRDEHLAKIARGEIWWCQGYSEPGSGSDLASLQTRAVDAGDHYVINGQKIWTSGADNADWIFCLVRTDPAAPKHEGISFMLFPMDQPGITVKPILLISGFSPFCETFFTDAIAQKSNLVGELNKGWSIAKRLLQFEREMIGGGMAPSGGPTTLDTVKRYVPLDEHGRIEEHRTRGRLANLAMNGRALSLTSRRAGEESKANAGPSAVSSMFKYFGTELNKERLDLLVDAMGFNGVGWEGETFNDHEISVTREWLRSKANSIEGGTSEVQLNIIAKRVLGLPD